MKYLLLSVVTALSIYGRSNFVSFFEIKLNQVSIYNSATSEMQVLEMEYDSLNETDLFEISYNECGMAAKNDYELHIKVENTAVDLTFINDAPTFTLNMGWFTQFKNRKASIYLYHTRYTGSAAKEEIHKIVDLFIA